MRVLKNFLVIVDSQTIIISLLAIFFTYLCNYFSFSAKMPSGLIGVAIIFPIVFSINAAYRRREEALKYFASFKAHAIALFYAHKDWVPDKAQASDKAIEFYSLLKSLFEAFKNYFVTAKHEYFNQVYDYFNRISASHESLRKLGVPANEVSRANQYLRAMMIEFERIRNIRMYRSPVSLRAYSQIFLNIFPLLYAPYFAYLCKETYSVIGYGVALIYSIVLVSLDNIQEGLEDPFDGIGTDDIKFDVFNEYEVHLKID
jgi:predicted membrane chloride channel (bestrophin family)